MPTPEHAKTYTTWARPGIEGTNTREYATLPDGPWVNEPDKVSWTDEVSGRPCLIIRGPAGALCGYAAVDPGHPNYQVEYMDGPDEEYDVHGGLTYSDFCADADDERWGICHVPEDGAPEHVWWFGFDCAHAWDLTPKHNWIGRDTYRDINYVVEQVEKLARQL